MTSERLHVHRKTVCHTYLYGHAAVYTLNRLTRNMNVSHILCAKNCNQHLKHHSNEDVFYICMKASTCSRGMMGESYMMNIA